MIICNLTNLRLAYQRVCERMHHANTKPAKRRLGRPGHLARAARELGYNPSHLWRVVKDGRDAPRTMSRYLEWRRVHIGQ
ncbi:MAG: hypothetical protein ACOYOU_18715 [Kiritimatiellia bacterium]